MALMPNNSSRTLWWTVAAAAGLALVAFGAFLFVNSTTTGRALDKADGLRNADLTLAAHDVSMKSIGQLLLIAQDAAIDVTTPADVDAAVIEVERTIAAMGDRFEDLDASSIDDLTPEFDNWQVAAMNVVSLASSGTPDQATEELVTVLVPASDALVAELTAERDTRAQAVEDSKDGANALARVAGFLTIFLIPVLAIIAYRLAARRQLSEAGAHLDARIEAEKQLGKNKDQFIVNVSYGLRAPLTSIYGYSEALLDQSSLDPQSADLVGRMNRESAGLTRMFEDLLVATHDEDTPLPLNISVVDMETQLGAAIAPFTKRGNQVGGTWGSGAVVADPLRVRQILRNLIANAIEHGGPDIRIYGDHAGSRYVVSVEDNGPGVPDEIVEKLFTRFVHGGDESRTSKSVGLGLAVARTLARAMGGSLDYDRVANRTAFVLSLPLATTDTRAPDPAAASEQ